MITLASHAWNYTSTSLRSGALPGLLITAISPLSNLIARKCFYPDLEKMRPQWTNYPKNLNMFYAVSYSHIRSMLEAYSYLKIFQLFLKFFLVRLAIKEKIAEVAASAISILAYSNYYLRKVPSEDSPYRSYWDSQSLIMAHLRHAYYLYYGLPASFYFWALSNISLHIQLRLFADKSVSAN